jgi:hypothetical protein
LSSRALYEHPDLSDASGVLNQVLYLLCMAIADERSPSCIRLLASEDPGTDGHDLPIPVTLTLDYQPSRRETSDRYQAALENNTYFALARMLCVANGYPFRSAATQCSISLPARPVGAVR